MLSSKETILGTTLWVERDTHYRGQVGHMRNKELGVLTFTDRRLVFAGKYLTTRTQVSMALDDITDVDYGKSVMGQRLTVRSNKYSESFSPGWRARKQFEQFTQALRDAVANAAERPT